MGLKKFWWDSRWNLNFVGTPFSLVWLLGSCLMLMGLLYPLWDLNVRWYSLLLVPIRYRMLLSVGSVTMWLLSVTIRCRMLSCVLSVTACLRTVTVRCRMLLHVGESSVSVWVVKPNYLKNKSLVCMWNFKPRNKNVRFKHGSLMQTLKREKGKVRLEHGSSKRTYKKEKCLIWIWDSNQE